MTQTVDMPRPRVAIRDSATLSSRSGLALRTHAALLLAALAVARAAAGAQDGWSDGPQLISARDRSPAAATRVFSESMSALSSRAAAGVAARGEPLAALANATGTAPQRGAARVDTSGHTASVRARLEASAASRPTLGRCSRSTLTAMQGRMIVGPDMEAVFALGHYLTWLGDPPEPAATRGPALDTVARSLATLPAALRGRMAADVDQLLRTGISSMGTRCERPLTPAEQSWWRTVRDIIRTSPAEAVAARSVL